MKIQEKNIEQKEYQTPQISRIDLDREISLQLASDTNPFGEPEWASHEPYQTNDWAKLE